MPTPFDRFGFTEAQLTVTRAANSVLLTGVAHAPIVGQSGRADSESRPVPIPNASLLIRRMIDGDHWLEGFGWIGPRPQSSADGFSETMALLHQGFISQNALLEVIERHIAGILGREPHWSLSPRRAMEPDETPTDAEATLISEAEAIVTEWWDVRKVHGLLREAAVMLLSSRRAPFRLFVPRGKLRPANVTAPDGTTKTVKVIDAADVPAGLNVIFLEVPKPEKAAVVEDPDTRERIGVVLYERGQNVTGTGANVQAAELTYLAEPNVGGDPLTIIKQTEQSAGRDPNAAAAMVRLDFGGRLTVYEMRRAPFVTSQMIQLQRALNLSLSALPRNVVTGGWLERVITNAQMPGRFVKDPTRPDGKRWVPDRHVSGGGSTSYLKGLRVDDGNGGSTYMQAGVQWRPPTDVAPTVDAQEALYTAILREARQEHVLMAQAKSASGKSREQARGDFENTLHPTAGEVNGLGRWLIETALAMAEAFAGTPGKYTKTLRAVFECIVDAGPITFDERNSLNASVTAGTLSRETAMAWGGVQDVAAELARIERDPTAQVAVIVQRSTAFATLVGQGADMEGAALAAGFSEDEAAELVPQLEDPPADSVTDPAADPANDPAAPPAPPAPPAGPPAAPPAPPLSRRQRQRQKGASGPSAGGGPAAGGA